MTFALPPLPYAQDALEPHISARTLSFHHGKHHKGYVEKLNELVGTGPLAAKPLERIIVEAAKDPKRIALFENAAQDWNHTMFWNSMSPGGGGAPKGVLAGRIEKDFGSFQKFKDAFVKSAVGQFGSGWTWLTEADGSFQIRATPDAANPLVDGQKALMCCDVWEHAYYLDYQNRRADFVKAFLDKLANWKYAEARIAAEEGEIERAEKQLNLLGARR